MHFKGGLQGVASKTGKGKAIIFIMYVLNNSWSGFVKKIMCGFSSVILNI